MRLMRVIPKMCSHILFLCLWSPSLAVLSSRKFFWGEFFDFVVLARFLPFMCVNSLFCVPHLRDTVGPVVGSVTHYIKRSSYTVQGLAVEQMFLEGVVCTLSVRLWLLFPLRGVAVWAFLQVCFDLLVEVILGKRRRRWWSILSPNKKRNDWSGKKDQAVTQRSSRA